MRVLWISDDAAAEGPLPEALRARGHVVQAARPDDATPCALAFAPATLTAWTPPDGATAVAVVDRDAPPAELPAWADEAVFEPASDAERALRLDALERRRRTDAQPWPELAAALVEAAPIGLALVRPGRSFLASPALATLTGHSQQELAALANRDAAQLIHPDDRARLVADARRADDGGGWNRFRLLRRDGGVVWVESWSLRTEYRGEPATLYCYLDVTERQQREAALEESAELLRASLQHLPVLVTAVAPDGRFRFWNREAERVTGWRADEVLAAAEPLALLFPDEDERGDVIRRHRAAPDGLRDLDAETTCRDGSVRRISWSAVRVPRAEEAFGRLFVGVDVTEERQAQRALQRSEERYRNLVDQAPEAIVVLDADTGRFADVNPGTEDLFGLPRAQLLESGPIELSPPVQPDGRRSDSAALAFIGQALEGEAARFDWVHRNAFGADVPCEILLTRLPSEEHNLVRGTITDVSWREQAQAERAVLEEALRHAQKMEAIGRLAGGVAHDFNNLLTGILAHAHDLRTGSPIGSPVYRAARTIERAADRAAELTRQLLGFARRGKYQTVDVDLDEAVRDVRELVGRTVDRRIRLSTDVAPGCIASGDPGQIQQVLLNLVLNAVDAMPHGGRVSLIGRQADVDPAVAAAHDGVQAGSFVRIDVRDEGEGIEDEVLEFIFEPFFTTKPAGEGTGMGLATVWGIVENHGGWVDVASRVGRGTTFTVWLPSVATPSDSVPVVDEARTTGPIDRIVRVLVVDDEPVVRDTVSMLLTGLGYEVRTEGGGAAAAGWFAAHVDEVDVVLLDLRMPGMDGRETFETLKAIDPDVRVVLSTGFGLDDHVQAVLDAGMRGFVQKPFRIAQLVDALEEAMR